jgi:hypothetical protein
LCVIIVLNNVVVFFWSCSADALIVTLGKLQALSSVFPDLVGKFHVMVHPDRHVKLSCVEMTIKVDKCADCAMIKNSVR